MTAIVDLVGVRIFRNVLTVTIFEIGSVTDTQTNTQTNNKHTNTQTHKHTHKSTDTLSLVIGLDKWFLGKVYVAKYCLSL